MQGQIDPDGTVTITFNMQYERLQAPGDDKHYLVCDFCGAIVIADKNVVSQFCELCVARNCDNCEFKANADITEAVLYSSWCRRCPARQSDGGPPYDHATATGMYDHL